MSKKKTTTSAAKKPLVRKVNPKAATSATGLRGWLKKHTVAVLRTRKATAGVLAVSYILAVYSAFTTSFIPGKYIGLGFLLSFAATVALGYVLITQKLRLKYLVIVWLVALCGICINLGVYTVGMVASSFISSLQESANSYEEYNIVALKKDAIKLQTPNQTIQVLQANATPDVATAIATETPAAVKANASPTESFLALTKGESQMALYTTAYMRELQAQTNNDVYQQLEVLATIRVRVANQAAQADITKPFAIYLSGIDTYGDISKTSRSDVNIIIAVNPKNHKILLVNTPRDYYVQLHGTTGVKDKLTHAGLYGISTSVSTLEDLYDININYNARINFTSLVKVIDAIGGVDVNSEYDFSSDGTHFKAGVNHLNGAQALAFSRERHAFEGGDRTRGQNQMKVIEAIIEKMSQPAMALQAGSIFSALSNVIQTNMPSSDINGLIRGQLDSMAKWRVASTSVDGTGASQPTYSMGAQRLYVMAPNQASVDSAKLQLDSYL